MSETPPEIETPPTSSKYALPKGYEYVSFLPTDRAVLSIRVVLKENDMTMPISSEQTVTNIVDLPVAINRLIKEAQIHSSRRAEAANLRGSIVEWSKDNNVSLNLPTVT